MTLGTSRLVNQHCLSLSLEGLRPNLDLLLVEPKLSGKLSVLPSCYVTQEVPLVLLQLLLVLLGEQLLVVEVATEQDVLHIVQQLVSALEADRSFLQLLLRWLVGHNFPWRKKYAGGELRFSRDGVAKLHANIIVE